MKASSLPNIGKRFLAVFGTAALGVGAFALPAAAQAPTPASFHIEDRSPITTGDEPALFTAQIAFGDDFPAGVHDVTATIAIDAPSGVFAMGEDGDDEDCRSQDGNRVECAENAADADVLFDFPYTAYSYSEAGEFDYTVTFAVDGETVAAEDGVIEVEVYGASQHPFQHGDVAYDGVEPGSTVDVAPEFLQAEPLGDEAAAVVVTVTHSEHRYRGAGPEAVADYDNCVEDAPGDPMAVACVVTDFADLPGTVFTFADPVSYRIGEDTPGPAEVCGCTYHVRTVDAGALEYEFGGVFWDEGSDDLFGLRAADGPGSGFHAEDGAIAVNTTENPYDLGITDLNVEGAQGDQVSLTTPVTNAGPASTFPFIDGPGAHVLLGDLPEGLELYWLESDTGNVGEWFCIAEEDWGDLGDLLPGVDPGELDFACFFDIIEAGDTFDFKLHVNVTDADSDDVGTLEVMALADDGSPAVTDGDPANDAAAITLNGNGPAQLPDTGSSPAPVFGAAAIALIAGVLLYVFTRRRGSADPTDAGSVR